MPNRQPPPPGPPDIDKALHDREGWSEYRRLVLDKLDTLTDDVKEIKKDVTSLKIKAAAWGFVAGSASAVGAAAIQFLSNKGGH
jgi:hypothetical protein